MKKKNIKNKLFLPDGCLTDYALEHFLEGDLSNDNRRLIEQHMETCDLCRDAVEGFRSLGIHNIPSDLKELIRLKVDENSKIRLVRHHKLISYISLAATLLVLVGLFFIFRKIVLPDSRLITEQEQVQNFPAPVEKEISPEKEVVKPREENNQSITPSKAPAEKKAIKTDRENFLKKAAPALEKEQLRDFNDETGKQQVLSVNSLSDSDNSEDIKVIGYAQKPSLTGVVVSMEDKDKSVISEEQINKSVNESILSKQMPSESEAPAGMVYSMSETLPTFEGGDLNKFSNYVYSHLRYPEQAAESGIEGRVFVSFVVDSTGKVADIKILRGVDSLLNSEAIRVISNSPLWKPGEQRGKPVNVYFTLPVNFKLDTK